MIHAASCLTVDKDVDFVDDVGNVSVETIASPKSVIKTLPKVYCMVTYNKV